jgi:hypothetical protein
MQLTRCRTERILQTLLAMTDEENMIVAFLRSSPGSFFTRTEIARRAVKRRIYDENPRWVDAPLAALVMQGVLEQDATGLYRLKRDDSLG